MSKHDDDKTPLQSVTIAADRWLRTPLALAGSAVVVVFLGGWWASNVWRDIQDIKAEQTQARVELVRQADLQAKQGEDIAQIRAWLNPNPSHPAVSQAEHFQSKTTSP